MNKKTRGLCAGALLATVLIAGCSAKGDAVFRLRKISISASDVMAEANRIGLKKTTKPDGDLAEQALKNLVVRGLVLENGLKNSEKNTLARLARRKADQECITLGMKRELGKRWDLSEECRRAFDENPGRFQLPESFRLQMIFLPNNMENSSALARKLLRRLQAEPKRFADLARKYSQGENASQGGITSAMPGSAVDPSLRSAISAHSKSKSPFLVQAPRGYFILRILDFWPAPGGDFEQLAQQIQERVSRELMAKLDTEIRAEVEKDHPVSIDQDLFLRPLIKADEPCLRIGQEDILVGDLFPQKNEDLRITGPTLAKFVRQYRSYRDAGIYFDCSQKTPPPPSDLDIVALRMESFLEDYVERRMPEELQHFFQIHQGAFRSSPRRRFDLWIFPFSGLSPLEARKAHEPEINRIIRNESIDSRLLKENGGSFFPDVELSVEEIHSWAPDLAARILGIEPGKARVLLRSRMLHADLIFSIKSKTPARDLEFARPDDRSVIVRTFIRDNRDEILENLYQNALQRGHFSRQALEDCRKELEAAE